MSLRSRCPSVLLVLAAGLPGVVLAEEPAQLAPVTVSASGASEARRNASATTLVYDREELDRLDTASVGDLLRKLPGTGLFADMDNRRGRGRGPDRNMPQILVDGQPLPGGERNPGAALRLPVELIERVEIIRSSTPEFPVTGTGGIINLILREAPRSQSGSLRAGLGSSDGDGIQRLEGQYGDRLGPLAYQLGASFQSSPINARQTNDVQAFSAGHRSQWSREAITDAGRESSFFLNPRLNWNLGQGRQLSLVPFFHVTDQERSTQVLRSRFADPLVGEGLAATGRDLEQEHGRRESGRISAEWREAVLPGSEWLLRLTAQTENERRDKTVYRSDAGGAATGSDSEWARREESEWGAMLKGKHLLGESHLLSGAVEWRTKRADDQQRRAASSGSVNDSMARIDDVREVVWIQDEWQLSGQHLLTPGLRWQRQRSAVSGQGAAHAHDFQSLDPSLNYLWQVSPRFNLRASIALNGKPPNAKDLSPVMRTATGVNTPSNPDRAGNPALGGERVLGGEVGGEWFLAERAGTIGVSAFRRQISDLMQRRVSEERGRWVERPYNVGDAVMTGGLLDYKVRLDALSLPQLQLRGNYSYTDTRIHKAAFGLGAGEGVRQGANFGLDYDIPVIRLSLGANYSYSAPLGRESRADLRQRQGVRRQLDLSAVQRIDRQLGLRLTASNILRGARSNTLQQTDSTGQLLRMEEDRERSFSSIVLALEAKW